MKKLFLFIVCLLSLHASLLTSTLTQNLSMESQMLDRQVNYTIYLPEDYDTNKRDYPVLYLLHGLGDDSRAWSQQGEVQMITDRAIASGDATPMIIIMPDAGRTWYVNQYDGAVNYEDMFFGELIPHIDSIYRTLAQKEFRAIAGLSMGGYGSLLYALRRPDLFAACCPLSAAVFTDEEMKQKSGFQELFGEGIVTEHWKQNSVLELVSAMPDSQKTAVRFFIDCGDDDFLYRGNSELHILMRDRGISHEYRVRDGNHNWTYWRESLPQVLAFVSRSFRRSGHLLACRTTLPNKLP